jgi:hypothetical protein
MSTENFTKRKRHNTYSVTMYSQVQKTKTFQNINFTNFNITKRKNMKVQQILFYMCVTDIMLDL